MEVTKSNGDVVRFDSSKVRKWVAWSVEGLTNRVEMEYEILLKTLSRLPEKISTEEIHQVMISVCLDKEDIVYSRVAAKLELASIYKNQERLLGIIGPQTTTFTDFLSIMEARGLWAGEWLSSADLIKEEETIDNWLIELEDYSLEYCTLKQWTDKYAIKIDYQAIETPAQGCLALSIALHGVTELAFEVARDLVSYKLNLPTPVLNGVRNGDYNSISCCLIEANDTVESLDIAELVASSMTAKKAGIGITYSTRSIGDAVKGGAVKHLGKQPLYRSLESAVKKYTQITRGGSATMTFKCIDPDVMHLLLLKTQRIDLPRRVDKIDYNFAYNDDFAKAVLNDEPWYLFSLGDAPEVHEAFHKKNYMDVVRKAMANGVKYTKVRALDVVESFCKSRTETSRVYCINLTRTNSHTPFIDPINQSNLCLEIALPTKGFIGLEDYMAEESVGEVAFCAIAALNVAHVAVEEFPGVEERALRTVDRMIEMAPMLTKGLRASLLKRKSVGIGFTGLASLLYKNGLDYDGSKESLDLVEEVAELHYYYLLKASQKIAAERGVAVKGINTYWLPIDTRKGTKEPILDWEPMRNKPRAHSVLVAHMPTESSSVFSNATNGVYPSRNRVIYKGARTGKVQFISEHFTEDKLTAWEVDIVPYYAPIQDWADQAISADTWVDFTKYPNKKVPIEDLVEWFLTQWYAGLKTAYYQNNLDKRGEEVELEDTCEGGSCKL
jgi:ribonucleoside-diphosphate reductase alpha chain